MSERDHLALINRLAAELGIFPRSAFPRMRFWRVKGDRYVFCWTTERDSKGKFYALKYRTVKGRKKGSENWKLTRQVAFGTRRIAKARARKWFKQREMLLEGRKLPRAFPPDIRRAQRAER